jgi:hypothetical protein
MWGVFSKSGLLIDFTLHLWKAIALGKRWGRDSKIRWLGDVRLDR